MNTFWRPSNAKIWWEWVAYVLLEKYDARKKWHFGVVANRGVSSSDMPVYELERRGRPARQPGTTTG
jgi:hypothetical protein